MALPEAEWGARSPAPGITEVPLGGQGRHRHLHEKLRGGGGFESPWQRGDNGVCCCCCPRRRPEHARRRPRLGTLNS